MKKVWKWIATHKWVVLLALTVLAALSLLFVDVDGVDNSISIEQYEVVE